MIMEVLSLCGSNAEKIELIKKKWENCKKKKKRGKTQVKKLEVKKQIITTSTSEIQRIIR
jgi:hypothetical protein